MAYVIVKLVMAQKAGRSQLVLNTVINIILHRNTDKYNISRENNVMQFLFSLLRIKGLYMLRTLLVHPQEAMHK
jgi:hypothetical protein